MFSRNSQTPSLAKMITLSSGVMRSSLISGTALTFCTVRDNSALESMEADLRLEGGEAEIFKPFNFRMEEIEGFRYRAKDAMRKVTSIAVKARDADL